MNERNKTAGKRAQRLFSLTHPLKIVPPQNRFVVVIVLFLSAAVAAANDLRLSPLIDIIFF
jgi:hypothetical protein